MIMNDGSNDNFYIHDGLGSVREIINSAGGIGNGYDYEAFGLGYPRVATWQIPGTFNRYTYTGRESDHETGLMYYRARMYDASTARFTSRDAVLLFANLYVYVVNNPLYYTDPLGEIIKTDCPIDDYLKSIGLVTYDRSGTGPYTYYLKKTTEMIFTRKSDNEIVSAMIECQERVFSIAGKKHNTVSVLLLIFLNTQNL